MSTAIEAAGSVGSAAGGVVAEGAGTLATVAGVCVCVCVCDVMQAHLSASVLFDTTSLSSRI